MEETNDVIQITKCYNFLSESIANKYQDYNVENIYIALLCCLDDLESNNPYFVRYKSNFLETASKYNIIKNNFD